MLVPGGEAVTEPLILTWPQVVVITMPGVLAFLTASLAAVLAYLSRRNVGELHIAVNSRLDQLLAANRRADPAEGAAERAGQSSRAADAGAASG